MRKSKVLIAMVGFKNPSDIVNCLRSLSNSQHVNFVVSVCENGGRAAYLDLVEALRDIADPAACQKNLQVPQAAESATLSLRPHAQEIHVLRAASNLGFAGGVNATLRAFSDDGSWSAVWLLNPDTIVHAQALRALIERQADTGADVVGSRLVLASTGKIQFYGGGRWRPLLARGYNLGLGAEGEAPVDAVQIERDLDFVSGAALYASREFIRKHGLMNEQFFLYYEEIEWCMRSGVAKLAYAHDAIVHHFHGSTIGSARKWAARPRLAVYLDERNRLLFARDRYRRIYPLVVIATFAMILRYLRHGSAQNFVVALHGWLDGLFGRSGKPAWLTQG